MLAENYGHLDKEQDHLLISSKNASIARFPLGFGAVEGGGDGYEGPP
jgi:hypothetical protein